MTTPRHPVQTDTLLFEHFATLATAPDGIARLRELILQLAVQGKLGTQDAGDEPASILLKKIVSEQKNKKKKNTATETIGQESSPYKIPYNWLWIRLGEIIDEVQPGFACGERDSRGIVQLRMNNINPRGDFIWDKILRVPFDEGLKQKFELRRGDILFNNTNSRELVGKSGVFKSFKEPIVFSNHFTRLRVVENRIDPALVTLWLHSQWNSKIFEKICNKWIGQAAVNGTKLLAFQFPLPPLAEQHRIVAKVDRLMALCDELDARQQQERAGCLKLGTASLAGLQNAASPEEFEAQWVQVCDAFDLILDCPENVAVLRQTILQLAVQGKLGTQDPGDEPAEKLVKRIGKEKERLVKEGVITREKPLEPVLDDEIPFVLPDSWKWVRINESAKIVEYGTSEKAISSPTAYSKDSVPVFRMNNIQNGKVVHENLKYLPNSIEGLPHLYLQNNDILINRTNSYELVGKAGIFKGEDDKFTFASYLIRISFFPQLVDPDFVNITLNASYFRTSQIEPQVTQQCGQANFSGSKIKNALIPLPPLAEQHRIVAKVDALMASCDALESRLKERAAVQEKFAGAVVKMVEG